MIVILFKEMLIHFFGKTDQIMVTLTAFIIVEFLSSCIVKCCNLTTQSKNCMGKRIMILLLVGVANICDTYLVSDGNTLRSITILYYIYCEGKVIFDNAKVLGLPVPSKLFEFLHGLYDEETHKDKK